MNVLQALAKGAKTTERLQREFNAYVDHITKQAPKAKAKSKAKQAVVVEAPPVAAIESAAPKKRGRKHKADEASAGVC